jgi:hypothetical protein
MHVKMSDLRLIVERFLKEQEDNWLGDEEEVISFTPDLKDKIKKAFKSTKNTIIDELKKSDTTRQSISNDNVDSAINIINNTYLHISSVADQKLKGIKAAAYHSSFGDEKGENRDVIHFDKIPEIIDLPSDIREKYNKDPKNNPIIVMFELYLHKLSYEEIEELLLHEVDHIKNSAIKALTGDNKFNVDEVKEALRKDLKNGTRNQIYEYILKHDGRVENPDDENMKLLVDRLSFYYAGLYEDPPDNIGVEELSVRLTALKREPDALEDFKSGKRKYSYFAKVYNTDIADIMLFIDENSPPSIETINKIVMTNTKQAKSVTA